MKNTLKKSIIFSLGFTFTTLISLVGYAARSNALPTQADNATITQTLWNNVIGTINDIGGRTEGIYSSGGNIGIGIASPVDKFQVNGRINGTFGKLIYNGAWSDLTKYIKLTDTTEYSAYRLHFFQTSNCGDVRYETWEVIISSYPNSRGAKSARISQLGGGNCRYNTNPTINNDDVSGRGFVKITFPNTMYNLKVSIEPIFGGLNPSYGVY